MHFVATYKMHRPMPLGEISIIDGRNTYSPILDKKAKSESILEENRD
jgi:hypothetical protein